MKLCLSAAVTPTLLSITRLVHNAQFPIAINRNMDKSQSNTEVHWGLGNELTKESRSFDKVAKIKFLFTGPPLFLIV